MKNDFLYIQLSNHIQKLIETGVLKPGDKLESVRAFSKQQGISISTTYKAYEELVIKNLIEARSKSGYYVKHRERHLPIISRPSKLNGRPVSANKIIAFALKKLTQKNIVKLSATAPDISLLPIKELNKSMNQALRLSEDSCINYENIYGHPELRRHISIQALQWRGVIEPDEVVITQGCTESIVLCLKTLTKPGDTIVIGRPTYFGLYNIIKSLGLKMLEVNIHPSEGLDFDYLEKCMEKVKVSTCLFVTNFNTPTGYCMKEEEKERLVGMLLKKNIPLIEDDIYGDIYFGSTRPRTCKSFDKKGMVLLCSSFSKTLAPGYRVGWCMPGRYKDKFLDLKLTYTVSSASPTQAAIAQFFNSARYDLHMNKLRKALHIRSMKYMKAIMDHFPKGTRISNPKGGFVFWIELEEKVNGLDVFYKAFDEGISIWPGQLFSVSAGFENFIRISFGVPFTDRVEKSIQFLGSIAGAKSVKGLVRSSN